MTSSFADKENGMKGAAGLPCSRACLVPEAGRPLVWMTVACALSLSGCTTFHGVAPVQPEVAGLARQWPTVSSLEPTLRWTPAGEAASTYDLIVYEAEKVEPLWRGGWNRRSPGTRVYYREGIQGEEHTIETGLELGREYLWSVRQRHAGRVSGWATYRHYWILGISNYWSPRQYFRFRTPAAPGLSAALPEN